MEREYEIFLTEEPAALAHAKTKAADEFQVERDAVSILGAAKLDDHGGPIGWRVRIRID